MSRPTGIAPGKRNTNLDNDAQSNKKQIGAWSQCDPMNMHCVRLKEPYTCIF